MFLKHKNKFSTTRMIASGFLGAIIIGTILLSLPIATRDRTVTPIVDSLFTATTSVCVTGLTTVSTLDHWSIFGKIVILVLAQFGGLGVITFSTSILMILGKRITLNERLLIQDAYNLDTLRGLVKLTKRIIKGTLIVEGMGAVLYSIQFVKDYDFFPAIGKAIFNSVSAFCNAGMDILGNESLAMYRGNVLVNLTTMGLIIIGGIGFPVWWDILKVIGQSARKEIRAKYMFRRLELHSKIALTVTAILIVGGAFLIFIIEYNNPATLQGLPLGEKILASFFQSVTTRTAGFLTIPQENFKDASTFIFLLLMFVGGSPSGTAGGVKTVTIALLYLSARSIVKGKNDIEVFRRKLPDFYLKKALSVVCVSLGVLIATILTLSVFVPGNFVDIVYEATSALATVGLTRNFTSSLNYIGKLIIICTMYLGRIGPITMMFAFNIKRTKGLRTLPEEKVLVG